MVISTPLMNMFGRSPIKPLEKHMDKVHACAQLIVPFFDAVIAEKWDEAEKLQHQINDLEHEADDIKRDLRLHMPKGMFMPVARSDLLELLHHQDHIANKTEDLAGLAMGRKIKIPKSMQATFKKFVARCIDASAQADKAINELDELLETGFRGAEVQLVEDMIHRLNEIETDSDNIQRELRKQLFDMEKDLEPVDVVFLYKVIDYCGELADGAQRVGGHLLILLAR